MSASQEEARIRQVIDDFLNALSEKRAERVIAHYTDDPALFTLAPPLVAKADDGGEGLKAWFATWQGPLHFEVRELEIRAGDGAAFASCLTRLSGTRTDGEETDVWFRRTLGLVKVAGAWKIAHEHDSVPFYMDGSNKAAIDLRP